MRVFINITFDFRNESLSDEDEKSKYFNGEVQNQHKPAGQLDNRL